MMMSKDGFNPVLPLWLHSVLADHCLTEYQHTPVL
jgi:hypothetical protein